MALIVFSDLSLVFGIQQIAYEQLGADFAGACVIEFDRKASVFNLVEWDTARLGFLPSTHDISLASLRYAGFESKTTDDVRRAVAAIEKRLQDAGL